MNMQTLGEFGLIDLIDLPFPSPESVLVGIGDDYAVLPYSDTHYQLVSCDLMVEDIHFVRKKIAPYQLGYKAVAVNLSDIA
ncbi:MAG: thiamine-phosphate kinase, partial [Peptococcaceae bacterium]|nr:thiamine-phosphate kinase [Peptococcaceae bacterium]